MGRNKQSSCEICSKVMRCDNLKRHMKIHESNTSSKTQTATSDDADQLDVSALADKVIDDKELEKVLINDDCVYRQKCKLGFQVEKIMKKYGIQKESLRSEFKEVLDQYLKEN